MTLSEHQAVLRSLTLAEFRDLLLNLVVYIRPRAEVFQLYAADGTPLVCFSTLAIAEKEARDHDYIPISVH